MADDTEIVDRELSTTDSDTTGAVIEALADIEGTEPDKLPPAYNCIDGMLEKMFSDPPSSDAQLEVVFTYAGYRITVKQNGTAEFVKVGDDPQ